MIVGATPAKARSQDDRRRIDGPRTAPGRGWARRSGEGAFPSPAGSEPAVSSGNGQMRKSGRVSVGLWLRLAEFPVLRLAEWEQHRLLSRPDRQLESRFDHEIEFGGLSDRQICGLGTPKNPRDIISAQLAIQEQPHRHHNSSGRH
jgi:hypothetical protein